MVLLSSMIDYQSMQEISSSTQKSLSCINICQVHLGCAGGRICRGYVAEQWKACQNAELCGKFNGTHLIFIHAIVHFLCKHKIWVKGSCETIPGCL